MRRRDHLLAGGAAGAVVADGMLVPVGIVLTDDDESQPAPLGKGTITNLGPSGLADTMSFAPRNLAPGAT